MNEDILADQLSKERAEHEETKKKLEEMTERYEQTESSLEDCREQLAEERKEHNVCIAAYQATKNELIALQCYYKPTQVALELEAERGAHEATKAELAACVEMSKYVADLRTERAKVAKLRAALEEIARPKRGIEAGDSDEEWLEYFRSALERERSTARAALAETAGNE